MAPWEAAKLLPTSLNSTILQFQMPALPRFGRVP